MTETKNIAYYANMVGFYIIAAFMLGFTPLFALYTLSQGAAHFYIGLTYIAAMVLWFFGAMGGWETSYARLTLGVFAVVAIAEFIFGNPFIALATLVFPLGAAVPDIVSTLRENDRWRRTKEAESYINENFGSHPAVREVKVSWPKKRPCEIDVFVDESDKTLVLPEEHNGVKIISKPVN